MSVIFVRLKFCVRLKLNSDDKMKFQNYCKGRYYLYENYQLSAHSATIT